MTTKNSQNKLLPCPFCGRKAEMFIHNGYNDPSRKGMRYIECYDDNEDGCGCKTEWFEEEQEAKLVEYWNTRPLLSQPAKGEKKELSEKEVSKYFEDMYIHGWGKEGSMMTIRRMMDARAKHFCSKFATKPSKVISKEEIEKQLRLNFDSFFHQVHFYVEIEGWYDDGIKNTAKAIVDYLEGQKNEI